MKVKYYMRGVGVGIILTVIVCSLGNKDAKTVMSNKEIIAAAKQLGMIENNEKDYNIGALKVTITPTPEDEKDKQITATPEAEPTKEPEITVAPEPTKEPELTVNLDSTQELENLDTSELPNGNDSHEEPLLTIVPENMRSFEIKSGMFSEAVAKAVQEAGLISDWEDFNKYLISNGHSSKIRTSKYSIPMGATYDVIADVITKRPAKNQ